MNRAGVIVGGDLVKYFLGRAEVDGIICNGVDKGNKRTYALLDERVPPMKELHKEEGFGEIGNQIFQKSFPCQLAGFYLVVGVIYNGGKTGGRVD